MSSWLWDSRLCFDTHYTSTTVLQALDCKLAAFRNCWALDILSRAESDDSLLTLGKHKSVTQQQSDLSTCTQSFLYVSSPSHTACLPSTDCHHTNNISRVTSKALSQYNFCGYQLSSLGIHANYLLLGSEFLVHSKTSMCPGENEWV